ncbi:RNA polymerase sigma-70 factor [Sphingobacterium sp. SGG-5]|uniref:RNA polymerase sigma-70 factor n=1 Tax=Sphingobacterium sp. SGG-5 TaxID=2710881 RepID=UPI0013EB9952|nr:RNA polymerase sigma-70 factor [Sphingobacterium sp. SGG-5]NGM61548.1 RNA polymerase sigma-70 factor [Sphingobacterium sp. SGG-5]
MLENKEKKFELIFRKHYKELHGYACRILGDGDIAEEAVQQVFFKLWERDWERDVQISLKAYLYRSIYNQSLNLMKRNKLKQRFEAYQIVHGTTQQDMPNSDMELRRQLRLALAQLPEKSRTVFEMSRFQELRYQEIADHLNVSLKTVEGHMTKVLKHLRIHLVDYLTILVLLFIDRS